MDANKRQRFSPPAIGGTSLLVVFAVLCLTVFALLSLTTVQADVRMADASAKAIEDYYAADCQAQEILARLRRSDIPEGVEIAGDVASYAVPISDTQELQVEVRLDWLHMDVPLGVAAAGYTVLRWQAVPAGEWAGNEALDLWDGT